MRDHPQFPSSPSSVLHSSLGTVEHEGGTAPSVDAPSARRPLFADRNFALAIACGVVTGVSGVVSALAYVQSGTLNDPDVVLGALPGVIAAAKACAYFLEHREDWKAVSNAVQTQEARAEFWQAQAELNGFMASRPFLGAGARGQGSGECRQPLTTSADVIQFPGREF